MASHVSTLYTLCLESISGLVRNRYWSPELSVGKNPFRVLPSLLIDDLIAKVVETIQCRDLLTSSDLRLLVRTGKVKDLRLGGFGSQIRTDIINFQEILQDFAPVCSSLRSITIDIKLEPTCNEPCIAREFNHLLSKARNIRRVTSNVYFDVPALRDCDLLETLILEFYLPENSICEFLGVDGVFKTHASLSTFIVSDSKEYSYSDVAVILKYCPQLTYTNCDISESLEHLHAEELRSGSLTHTYKIRKCVLGHMFFSTSSDSVRIASLTCPFLQELKVYVADDEAIAALCDCRNLDNLDIKWTSSPCGDYTKGLRGLVEKSEVGRRLKVLKIKYFINVDFYSIGMCCSNLEQLGVDRCKALNPRLVILPNIFQNLHSLNLIWCDGRKELLIGLVCSAPNLERLTFFIDANVVFFTDDELRSILSKNSLSNLKNFECLYPQPSLDGWRNLARSLAALECVRVPSLEVEGVRAVFSEINPRVIVCNWFS